MPALMVREAISPAGIDSREPELYATPDGRVIMSWVEKIGEKRAALRFASRDGAGWSEPRTIAEGDNWFVNWADFPSVIALKDGTLAAHWLVKSGPGTYAYDVNLALSKDGGKTWSKPIIPHTDGTQTEHGFVSLVPLADGRLGAVWVDGRALKDIKVDEDAGPLPVSMALRFAAIDTQGKVSDEAVLDERICECCQTSAAMTAEGAIAAYRDRSESEVRDIYVVRQENGKWSVPQPVHADGWEMTACPVNGPSIAADGQRVAVAWYTEANDQPRVKMAFSNDAGKSFGNPVQVDDGDPVGRVDVLLLVDGSALVVWMSGTAEKGATKVRRVRSDGTLDAISTVTETNIARSSGFPRIARLGNEVLFAWTQFGKPSRVSTAIARLE
ncbi:MAG: exo-alpha-sialidase [Pyrinomonadaceae bacterium]|nr:exo-alpha-sialidase [Pyrinomonadaceae bacterium]